MIDEEVTTDTPEETTTVAEAVAKRGKRTLRMETFLTEPEPEKPRQVYLSPQTKAEMELGAANLSKYEKYET